MKGLAQTAFGAVLALGFLAVFVFVPFAQCLGPSIPPNSVDEASIEISELDAQNASDLVIAQALSNAYYAAVEAENIDLLIARSNDLNAASFGGGRFVFWEAAADLPDDQLHALAAHEVAHDVLLHSLRAQDTAAFIAFLAEVLSLVGGADRRGEENIRGWLNTAILPRYSRSQEFQADEYALSILRDLGYQNPPEALAGLLEELMKRYGDTGGGFTDSHPATSARIAAVREALSSTRATSESGR